MASETSNLSDDIPKRSECKSQEEFQEKINKYYEQNGLRKQEDFSEDEKKSIIEKCTVKLIGPKVLSQQYKTSVFVIRRIVSVTGKSNF